MAGLIRKLGGLFAHFCIATVLAEVLLLGYALSSGVFDEGRFDQMLAVAHGADLIPAELLAEAKRAPTDSEQSSLQQVEDIRSIRWRNFEMRENVLAGMLTEFKKLRADLEVEKERFQRVADKFKQDADKKLADATDAGRREFQAVIENMKPKQAREHLMITYNAGNIDVVVDVMKSMDESKRAKIVAEFKSPEDAKVLNDILDRIRNPELRAIDESLKQINAPTP
jgi:hypothetical protein